jgi:subtilase family serine protease
MLWAALLAGAGGRAAEVQVVRGHVPEVVSKGLAATGRIPRARQMQLAIGLPLRNQDVLTQTIRDLYDPQSPSFRRFLTAQEFARAFGPTEIDYQIVREFMESNGLTVTRTFPTRMLLDVRGAAADVEKAFHVNLRFYPHPTEARNFYAPDVEPTVAINAPILNIAGLSDFALPRPSSLHPTPADFRPNAGSQGGQYVGLDFRAAYAPGVTLNGTGQSVALVEFDTFYPGDLTKYLALTSTGLAGSMVNVVPIGVDESTNTAPGVNNSEVALDIDMAIAMAPGLANLFVYEAPTNGSSPDDVLTRIAADNSAQQISSSWSGFTDAAIRQAFQEFAAQGQTFFIATGDTGAYAYPQNPVMPPVDDPLVTSVGGTSLSTAVPRGAWSAESTWSWFSTSSGTNASGGGISPNFAIPSWQEGISMAANQGSTDSRNIPDVAMVADHIFIYANNGVGQQVGGTSAAAPLWAGLMALINQQNANVGNPPQGYFNPGLYALARGTNYAACFHDVTTGNNTNLVSSNAFFAATGYDLCTGWGTPMGSNLISLLAAPLSILQVVQNGGFETGDFTGWVLSSGAGAYNFVGNADALSQANSDGSISYYGQYYIHSGTYAAFMAEPNTLATLQQAVTTASNRDYLLSFWLANPSEFATHPIPNQFMVKWNGNTLFNGTNLGIFSFTNMQFVVAATNTTSVLAFGFRNDRDYFGLDDVSASLIPVPAFQSAARSGGGMVLRWSAMSNVTYQLQYSTSLGPPAWMNLGAPITAAGNSVSTSDLQPPNPERYYRVVIVSH